MEQKDNNGENSKPSLLNEVFAMTNNGRGQNASIPQAQALQQLHARLGSYEFAAQMTGIFFAAKRAALSQAK